MSSQIEAYLAPPKIIKSSVVWYITTNDLMFLILALFATGEEILFHLGSQDVLFWGGLYCLTLQLPPAVLIIARMSQRVGYTKQEKSKMSKKRRDYINSVEAAFPAGKTAQYTLLCILLVLGVNLLSNILTLQILPVEKGFFYVNIAIDENHYYQVALIIGLTAMLMYPKKIVGFPTAIAYIASIIIQAIAPQGLLKILLNTIPTVILALFFGLAKRDINKPSRRFNYGMAFLSAAIFSSALFFVAHFGVYGSTIFTWIGTFGSGLVMALFYIKTRNVSVTTWAHVVLNLLALPALILATWILVGI